MKQSDDTYTLMVHLVPDSIALGQNSASLSRLKLLPNPAIDVVHFSIVGDADNGSTRKVEIWSAVGRFLSSNALTQNNLLVAALQSGFYRQRMTNENGALINQTSFLKQKSFCTIPIIQFLTQ